MIRLRLKRWSVHLGLVMIPMAVTFTLFYVHRNNPGAYWILLIGLGIPTIIVDNYLYRARKIKDEEIPRYIYHLLSKQKLDRILAEESKNRESGYVNIRLHPTKSKLHNYSTFGKAVCYFHSSLKGYSYFFNHIAKMLPLDYLLVVDARALNKDLIKTRNVDRSILYCGEYVGKAKLFKSTKFKFFKWEKVTGFKKIAGIDNVCTVLKVGLGFSLALVLMKPYFDYWIILEIIGSFLSGNLF